MSTFYKYTSDGSIRYYELRNGKCVRIPAQNDTQYWDISKWHTERFAEKKKPLDDMKQELLSQLECINKQIHALDARRDAAIERDYADQEVYRNTYERKTGITTEAIRVKAKYPEAFIKQEYFSRKAPTATPAAPTPSHTPTPTSTQASHTQTHTPTSSQHFSYSSGFFEDYKPPSKIHKELAFLETLGIQSHKDFKIWCLKHHPDKNPNSPHDFGEVSTVVEKVENNGGWTT